MVLETTLVPGPPYSLAASARLRNDPTRSRPGRYGVGLVGDLGLVKLCRALHGPGPTRATRASGSSRSVSRQACERLPLAAARSQTGSYERAAATKPAAVRQTA